MKTRIKTLLAALMLLAISCKKENSTIQSSGITGENNSEAVSSDANELAWANAVKIGNQVWKTQNLTTGRYRNGDKIPEVRNAAKWAALTTGAWCWYNNDSATGAVYGKLYNWYAVHDPRRLAPEGWHIPSDSEWTTLTTFLGGAAVAGGKMKETGTTHWLAPNTDATNSSGFTGLPDGGRGGDGLFYGVGYYGYWWSSAEYSTFNAWSRYLYYYYGYVGRLLSRKHYGLSVRCLRD